MPELPDVEVYRQYVDATALKQTVKRVQVNAPKVLRDISARSLGRRLAGQRFKRTSRRGKHLFVELTDGSHLLLHFGMTGNVHYDAGDGEKQPKFAAVVFTFENDCVFSYVNKRKLGTVSIIDDPEEFAAENRLGPDALSLSEEQFLEKLNDGRGGIKAFLMNQRLMAGIGNEYSDEILFQARLHPAAEPRSLDRTTRKRLFRTLKSVLHKAIECRVDPEKFPRSFITPRRREGAPCPRGNGTLVKKTVAGRSSYFCPQCQQA